MKRKRLSPDKTSSEDPPNENRKKRPRVTLTSSSSSKEEETTETEEDEEYGTPSSRSSKPYAGIIETIYLENFMCHRKLTVDLQPSVNIITGDNGSGKSAIAEALKICLGSRNTRFDTLSSVISTGKDYCIVRVKFRNQGSDSYRNEVYGKSITVERTINRKGSKYYKIIDCDGEVISRHKKELDRILLYYNILINNPMMILNQDRAKVFLAQSTPKKKYELFLQASQLQNMVDDFNDIRANMKMTEQENIKKRDFLERDRVKIEKMKRDVDIATQIDDIDEQKKKLFSMKAWRLVQDSEAVMKEAKDKFENYRAMYEQKNTEMQDAQRDLEEKKEKDTLYSTQIEGLIAEKRQLGARRTEITREKAKCLRDSKTIEGKIKDNENRIKNNHTRIKKLKKKIEDIKARPDTQQSDFSEQQREYENEIEKVKIKIKDCENKSAKGDSDINGFDDKYHELKLEYEEKCRQSRQITKDIKDKESEKRKVRGQMKDRMVFFEKEVVTALKIIQNNSKLFKIMPIGPLGLFLNVTSNEYASAAESYLYWGLARTFLVSCWDDYNTLKQIISSKRLAYWKFRFIRCNYCTRIYNVQRRGNIPRLFDCLKIDTSLADKNDYIYDKQFLEPTIMNCIIDNFICDRVLMESNRDDVYRIYKNRWPQNCTLFLCKKGTTVSLKNNIQVTQNKDHTATFLGTNKNFKSLIDGIDNEIEILKREDKVAGKETGRLSKEMKIVASKMEYIKKEKKKRKVQIRRLKKKIENLKRDINNINEPIEDTRGDEIDQNEEDIKECERDNERFAELIRKLQIKMGDFSPKIVEYDEAVADLLSEMHDLQEKIDSLQDTIEKFSKTLYDARNKLNHATSDCNKAELLFKRCEENYKIRENNFQGVLNAAKTTTENGERIYNVEKTYEQISKELEDLRRFKNQRISILRGITAAEVKELYINSYSVFNKNARNVKDCEINHKSIIKGLNKRFEKWKTIRYNYGRICSLAFNNILSQKSHSGSILFDHEESSLQPLVTLNKEEDYSVSDSKQLSGGERSFSTLALILSFWDVCETPFRVLDEVDIYMDSTYRQKALELLLTVSRNPGNKRRQLIIITPQTTSFIKRTSDIKVIKLKDPVRVNQNDDDIEVA